MRECSLDLPVTIICSIILFPTAALIYPLLSYLVGTPIIFKQKRMGKNGQIFTMYKIRSMYKNAEITKHLYLALNQAPAPMFKVTNDPRFIEKTLKWPWSRHQITWSVGQFLSQSGLDELPQVINILRGEMSWFGPRPLPVQEALTLAQTDPTWSKWRQSVLPGIFSVWALDSLHNKSLAHWKKLEQRTIEMSTTKRWWTVLRIVGKQIANLLTKPIG